MNRYPEQTVGRTSPVLAGALPKGACIALGTILAGLLTVCAGSSPPSELPLTVSELLAQAEAYDGVEVELAGIFLQGEFEFRGFIVELRITQAGEFSSRGGDIYSRLPTKCIPGEAEWTRSPTGRSAWAHLKVRGRFQTSAEPTGPEPGYLSHLRILECRGAAQSESED